MTCSSETRLHTKSLKKKWYSHKDTGNNSMSQKNCSETQKLLQYLYRKDIFLFNLANIIKNTDLLLGTSLAWGYCVNLHKLIQQTVPFRGLHHKYFGAYLWPARSDGRKGFKTKSKTSRGISFALYNQNVAMPFTPVSRKVIALLHTFPLALLVL